MTPHDKKHSNNKDTFSEQKQRFQKYIKASYFKIDYWRVTIHNLSFQIFDTL